MSETTTPTAPGLRTYPGSCHCGAVHIEADIDLSAGTGRCNCTICTKSAWWGINLKPGAVRVLAGEEMLADYALGRGIAHHRFCSRCGIRLFGHGNVPEIGGEFVSVNLNCLDDVDFTGVIVSFHDGRHDTWEQLAVRPWVDPFARDAR